MKPKQRSGGQDRGTRRLLLAMAAVMAAVAVGVLAYVAGSFRTGTSTPARAIRRGAEILLYPPRSRSGSTAS